MLRIKKDDFVKVIAGKDKGKTGKVMVVFPKMHRALVERVNLVKKAQRRTQQNPQGGIVEVEAPIHISNIMLVEKKGNQPTRFKASLLKDGTKQRVAVKSGEGI